MASPRGQGAEMMVIDTVQEIAPGIVEVDEYVVESAGGGAMQQGGGSEPESGGE